jgi:hypothetical protein
MTLCIHRSLTILLLAALLGCTTMQEVKQREGLLTDYLEIGDHIIVYAIVHDSSSRTSTTFLYIK